MAGSSSRPLRGGLTIIKLASNTTVGMKSPNIAPHPGTFGSFFGFQTEYENRRHRIPFPRNKTTAVEAVTLPHHPHHFVKIKANAQTAHTAQTIAIRISKLSKFLSGLQ